MLVLAVAVFASCKKATVPVSDTIKNSNLKAALNGMSLTGIAYYVDPAGDDNNDGKSTGTAWKSISKVNAMAFEPGDLILFKSGGVWNDTLRFKSSGTAGAIITVDKYGGTALPVINGGGKVNGSAALLLNKVSYFEVNNLEITNTVPGGVSYAATGIKVVGGAPTGDATTNVSVKNCYVHDVNSPIDGQANYNKASGGIILDGKIYGALVQGCRVSDCTVEGIRTNGSRDMPARCKDIIIDNNLVENVYGDGIVMSGVTGGSKITHNTVHNVCMSKGPQNYAAVWTIGSINTLVAYNEVYGVKGGGNNDGNVFDADGYDTPSITDGDIFEYNYSHDNNGGFMLFMHNSKNITVRYNVSVNDVGSPINSDKKKLFFFEPSSYSSRYIYNNVFYSNNPIKTVLYGTPSGTFSNNIFYSSSTIASLSNTVVSKSVLFNNNCFYPSATFSALNWGTSVLNNNFYTDPSFVNPVSGTGFDVAKGYNVKASSVCLNAGIYIGDNGGKDFSGNPLPTNNPDVGAFQHSGGNTDNRPSSFGAIADSYVRNGNYGAENYGSLSYMVIKADAAGYARKAYAKFDFTAASVSKVQSANLSLYVSGVNTAATRTISVYTTASNSWGETSINWNNAPIDATYIGQIVVTGVGTYTLDVSNAINAQLPKSDRSVSFLLQNNGANSGTNDININSREASSNKPAVILTY